MVLVCHISEYRGDGTFIGLKNGVMLFFALSGYLLYRPFVRGPVDLRRYASHRVARILPAYLGALLGVSLLTSDGTFFHQPATYLLFAQNYDAGLWQGFLGVAWTLVLEVQFYLVLPVLAVLVARSVSRLMIVALLSLLGALIAFTLTAGGDPRIASSLFPFMLWAFTPGMFVALLEHRASANPVVLLAGIALLVLGTQALWASIDLASAVGAGLVIAWTVARRPTLGWFAPIASVGAALTYAAYLWHVDIIKIAPSTLAAIVVTLVIASASYVLVERPILHLVQSRRALPARV